MRLGDVIEKATKALGVEPCNGCNVRKGILNDLGRRGFIQRTAAAMVMLRMPPLITSDNTGSVGDALQVMRMLNTFEARIFESHHVRDANGNHVSYGPHATLAELMAEVVKEQNNPTNTAKNNPKVLAWLTGLNPTGLSSSSAKQRSASDG